MASSAPSPERWRKIRAVLESALDVPRGERPAFLERACADDADLRRAVEDLLAREPATESGAFLDPPLRDAAPRVLSLFAASSAIGERIGAYRITDVIGIGGMGAVYRAIRADDAFDREVAVKVVRSGLGGDEALAAFDRERRLLARLDHPGITRLLDGGTARDGSPYLVMELVHGRAIDRFCDEERLSLEERLALFRGVCDAAHHAHRSLVIHRDLKPSNVLVTDEGAPKLVDFGVAALFGRETALAAMTPPYASPEARRGDALLTTAADVYSLGVLLGDLAGVAPRADVAAIAARACDPDPRARYGSAAELAADVGRFLDGFPVAARPGSALERARKFAARHRAAVALAAGAFLVVGSFAVTAALLASRLSREKADAVAARRVAERVSAFLGETFAVANPRRLGADATVLEALADAGSRVDAELSDAPAVAAGVHAAIGRTYSGLGLVTLAEPHLRTALRLSTAAYGDRAAPTAEAMERLSIVLAYLDREEAIPLATGALERYRAGLEGGDARVAAGVHSLAFALYRGAKPPRFSEAEELIEEAIERYRRLAGGKDDADVARAHHMYAAMRLRSGRAEESDELYRKALATYEAIGLESDPQAVDCRVDHAICLVRLRRFDEAEAALRSAMEPLRRVYGEPGAVSILSSLSDLEIERGNAAAALALAREALARIGAAMRPGDDVDFSGADPEKTIAFLAPAALESERAGMGYSSVLSALGAAMVAAGRCEEAVPVLREAARLRAAALPPGDWRTECARSELGGALVSVGDRDEGLPLLVASLGALEKSLGAAHWEARAAARRLAEALGE